MAAGEQGSGVIGLSIPTDQGLAGYVYSTGQALALSDVERDRRFGRAVAEKTAYIPTSIVAVPLVDGEGTIGVLEVLDKRDSGAFSLRDVELASVFARQAAIAISASRVERDTASLLAEVARRAAGDAGTPPGTHRRWTRSWRRPAASWPGATNGAVGPRGRDRTAAACGSGPDRSS